LIKSIVYIYILAGSQISLALVIIILFLVVVVINITHVQEEQANDERCGAINLMLCQLDI